MKKNLREREREREGERGREGESNGFRTSYESKNIVSDV
jgi:hypothetical protein